MTNRNSIIFSRYSESKLASILWSAGFHDFSIKGQKIIADYFDRDPRTIRRWFEVDEAPKWAIDKLLTKRTKVSDEWQDFTFLKDRLITPNGYSYTPNQLMTLAYQVDRLKSLGFY